MTWKLLQLTQVKNWEGRIINGAPGSIDNDANIANMAFTIEVLSIPFVSSAEPSKLP